MTINFRVDGNIKKDKFNLLLMDIADIEKNLKKDHPDVVVNVEVKV